MIIPRIFSIFAAVMRNLPTITRYLLIANICIFLIGGILESYHIDLNTLGGLHFFSSPLFHWWQPLTYMFLHADWQHLFFNMFAVWMFAPVLEQEWGERRFLFYYLLCGLGAGLVQELVWSMMPFSPMHQALLNTIGASGAVFGILFAFGWLYPNTPMFLFFIPIPIRARTFVIIYALIELLTGIRSITGASIDNVAHFAHLGGMLFGWLVLLYWRYTSWREPQWKDWMWKIKQWCNKLFRRHQRLDSTKKNDYDKYHYHKRL